MLEMGGVGGESLGIVQMDAVGTLSGCKCFAARNIRHVQN